MVERLIVEEGVCKGVVTQAGAEYTAKTVVITTGTFLRGEIIMGDLKYSSIQIISNRLLHYLSI